MASSSASSLWGWPERGVVPPLPGPTRRAAGSCDRSLWGRGAVGLGVLRRSARARYVVGLAPTPSRAPVDAEGIAGGARPEFPQRMPVALAPCDQSLRVFPVLTEEGDDAVGELAEGHLTTRS